MTDTAQTQSINLTRVVEAQEPPPPEKPVFRQVKPSGDEAAWDRVIRVLVYVMTFLLPVLFTPWTFEPLELSKQMLLFTLTSVAMIVWVLKLLVFRDWKLVKTPLDLPIWIFVGVYFLASVFSVDRVASFIGYHGSYSGNFFQVLFLALFYYLVVNHFTAAKQLRRLFGVFCFSVFLTLLFVMLQFFGFHAARFEFARASNFNTVGPMLLTALFAALGVITSLGASGRSWLSVFGGRLWRGLAAAFGFIVLLTVNFNYAWTALLAGLLLYIIFSIWRAGKNFNFKDHIAPTVILVLVVALLAVQLVFPFISFGNIFDFDLPRELRLDYSTAGPVLAGVVKTKPVLGSGPNTFLYAFSKYRDPDFNLSPYWNVRFDKGPSQAADLLVGTGIVGLLAFEILALIALLYGLYFLIRRKEDGSVWNMGLILYAAIAALWVAHWFFFFNTVIAFSFWLLVAMFMALTRAAGGEKAPGRSFSMAASPRQTVSVISLGLLSLVLVVIFLFFSASLYAADIFYRQGLVASNNPESYDRAQASFERAIQLNRFRPDYYLTYGEFLFLRINQELTKPEVNAAQVQMWLASSINTSRRAIELSPNNWTAWERLANLYTSARPLVAGVDKFIVEFLEKAAQNDPNNPLLRVELGQVYLLSARSIDSSILGEGADSDSDGLSDAQEQVLGSDPAEPDSNANGVIDGKEVLAGLNPAGSGPLPDSFLQRYIRTNPENLIKAEEQFRKAIALKADYAAAYYQLSLVLQQANKPDQAIAELAGALERFPSDITIKFELGRLYYNTGATSQAASQFQEILALAPVHANARFSLALSYERLGRLLPALTEYRRLGESNPDNELIKAKIEALEAALGEGGQ